MPLARRLSGRAWHDRHSGTAPIAPGPTTVESAAITVDQVSGPAPRVRGKEDDKSAGSPSGPLWTPMIAAVQLHAREGDCGGKLAKVDHGISCRPRAAGRAGTPVLTPDGMNETRGSVARRARRAAGGATYPARQ
jgi:hypothetical protein